MAVERDEKGHLKPGSVLNPNGRKPKGQALAEVLRAMGAEPLPTDEGTTHQQHWWGAVAHALDLLAEEISTGAPKPSQLSAFKVLMEMWHERAYGKPPQPLQHSGDTDNPAPIVVKGWPERPEEAKDE